MTEVLKIVNNYYNSEAAVKLNFNTFNTSRVQHISDLHSTFALGPRHV